MNTSLLSPRRAVRPARLAALAGAALLTLTGCLQADLGVTLNDDESGEFRVRTVINRAQFTEMEEMFGGMMSETDPDDAAEPIGDPCAEMLEQDMSADELPPGTEVQPINDGDWCGAMATIPFANLDEFNSLAADFADESDDETSLGAPSISKTASGYRFTVTGLAMSDEGMGLDEGGEGMEGMEELGGMIEQFVQDMRISYDVRLPGKPVDHNADAVDGNRFQWTLEWGDTRTELFAETGEGEPDGSADTGDITESGDDAGAPTGDGAAPGAVGEADDDNDDGSSLTWLWIVLGVVVVGGIVAAIVITQRKKKGGSTPGAPSAPLPPPGQPSPGWQPPAE